MLQWFLKNSKYSYTQEEEDFFDTLLLIFHQIFLFRIKDIHLSIENPSNSHESLLVQIQSNIRKYPYLVDNSILFNTYEKITFENFIKLLEWQISWITADILYSILESQEEKSALIMRLMADFEISEKWYEYMEKKYGRL